MFLSTTKDHTAYSMTPIYLGRASVGHNHFLPWSKYHELAENLKSSSGGNSSETCLCGVGRAVITPSVYRILAYYLWCGHRDPFHSLSITWMRGERITALITYPLAWEMVGWRIFEGCGVMVVKQDGKGIIISITNLIVQLPGRIPIRLCKACLSAATFCSWVLTGRGHFGKTPPGQMDSWRSRRYCSQRCGHVRLATCTSSHLWWKTGERSDESEGKTVARQESHQNRARRRRCQLSQVTSSQFHNLGPQSLKIGNNNTIVIYWVSDRSSMLY